MPQRADVTHRGVWMVVYHILIKKAIGVRTSCNRSLTCIPPKTDIGRHTIGEAARRADQGGRRGGRRTRGSFACQRHPLARGAGVTRHARAEGDPLRGHRLLLRRRDDFRLRVPQNRGL